MRGPWLVAALVAGALAGAAGLRRARLEPVVVAGGSMAPTLAPGTLLAVGPVTLPPRRGQLVVVRPAAAPEPLELVKRVVGLPGELVGLSEGRLRVDGRAVAEPYLGWPARPGPDLEVLLGPGEYLVLGDRRDASTDGRSFGPVTLAELGGVVKFAYWPPSAWRRWQIGGRRHRGTPI